MMGLLNDIVNKVPKDLKNEEYNNTVLKDHKEIFGLVDDFNKVNNSTKEIELKKKALVVMADFLEKFAVEKMPVILSILSFNLHIDCFGIEVLSTLSDSSKLALYVDAEKKEIFYQINDGQVLKFSKN